MPSAAAFFFFSDFSEIFCVGFETGFPLLQGELNAHQPIVSFPEFRRTSGVPCARALG